MERTTWIHLNDSFPWTVIQLTESGLDHCLPHPQSLNCRWHRCWKCEHEAFWPYQDSMTEVQTGPFKWPKINCSPGFHTVAGVLAVPLAAEAGLGQREGDEIMFPWYWCIEQGFWQTPTGCTGKSCCCCRLLFLGRPVHFSAPGRSFLP